MMLIVAHHYVVNSGLTDVMSAAPTSWRTVFLLIFGAWGKTGINCFVLITGYFMCKSQITLKKFLKLVLEVQLYKIIFFIVFLVAGLQTFTLTSFITVLLPIGRLSAGFPSCYLMFFLLIPFLNILIQNLNEKQHVILTSLLLFMYTIIGSTPRLGVTMNYVSWFAVLYMVSSYFRMYPRKIWQKTKLWGVASVVSLAFSIGSIIGVDFLGAYFGRNGFDYAYWLVADSNKIFAFTLAVTSFLFFKNVKIKQSKFINTVAASTFGVLLIHGNCSAMKKWLWRDTLNNVGMYSSKYMVLHAIGSVLAVYIICTVIDYFRILLLEKPFFRFYDKHYDSWKSRVSAIANSICKKLNIQSD